MKRLKNIGSFSLEYAMVTVILVILGFGVAGMNKDKILNTFENSANNAPVLNLQYDSSYDSLFISPFMLESNNARGCITVGFNDLEATGSGKNHNALDISMGWRCSLLNLKNPNEYMINAIIGGEVVEVVENVETNTSNTCNINPEGEGCHGSKGNYIKTITYLEDDYNMPYMIKVLYYHIDKNSASDAGISVGSVVTQGQLIAREGHNGLSSGYHLHLEISMSKDNGTTWTKLDPEVYINWKARR